ncbi:conserved hypothetical protein [Candidatus Desulfosporosinus infrequens]|uniref:Uncharacterized protein n=1 Tax=Candidatus Desulfosporosinus infrequens TaxID=2043169 RepID=A0A2U3KAK7_9FIRM|nr:conserved hypothetical protein [Candidatus Desulfosporosinus infrequens]
MKKEDTEPKGAKEMSVPEKDIKSLNQTLWEIAEKNTKRNSNGLTVCSKDCPYREEPEWETSIEKSKNNEL